MLSLVTLELARECEDGWPKHILTVCDYQRDRVAVVLAYIKPPRVKY